MTNSTPRKVFPDRKRAVTTGVLLFAMTCAAPLCAADAPYPTKPIRMMTASTIGSGPDVIARLMGTRLTELWGQQVVVDNRAGASGLIGAELVAKSAPDGHTLWMATMTQLISTTMYQRYMMTTDFAPVAIVASTPFVIAVSATLPVKSLAEFIAYAKTRPGEVMYGSGGQGSTPHLCMELLQSMAGIKLAHVPYKGSVIALTDMMGGQMHSTCAAAPALPPFVQGGKVRSLGVTTREPTQLAPGLATVADTVPGYELVGWYGVLAPRATPKDVIARINKGLADILRIPEVQARLIAVGAEAAHAGPAEMNAFLQKETARWGKVLRDANIRPPD
jgi:tripartite-type tricarboxylate transporter receptor subunit TctC